MGYFDVGFHGVEYPFDLSTSPQDIPTHWKQTIFYFQDPITVNTGKATQCSPWESLKGHWCGEHYPGENTALIATYQL